VEEHQILTVMRSYFAEKVPAETLADFPRLSPSDLLKESLDVVDFVLYLEEELGREIDITRVGPALVNLDFGKLAGEVARYLAEG
jgi:acyl carrier protein